METGSGANVGDDKWGNIKNVLKVCKSWQDISGDYKVSTSFCTMEPHLCLFKGPQEGYALI